YYYDFGKSLLSHGQFSGAIKALAIAEALGFERRDLTGYYQARAASSRKDFPAALRYLEASLSQRSFYFDLDRVRKEPDFAPWADSPEFRALLAKHDHKLTAAEKDIVGVWQRNNMMADGWSDAYQFFADRTFLWHKNQMDERGRDLTRTGTWKVREGELLISEAEKVVLVGGEFSKEAEGIVGGKEETRKNSPPLETSSPIRTLRKAAEDHYPSMGIDGRTFWKFGDNPNGYTDEFSLTE
ncbi:MAG: hypothetical protein AAB578_07870, partial [Elusimicrobiota bacterium]